MTRNVAAHCNLTMSRSPSRATQLVPAARWRPGLCQFLPPDEGWAERRQAPGCSGTRLARRVTQANKHLRHAAGRALARRPCVLQRKDARLSPLHHGDFGSGFRASISGISSRSVQRSSSQPGRSAWRTGSQTSREHWQRANSRGTPFLAPPSGSSLENAPHEQG